MHGWEFGDPDGAVRLMQSATELDPTFAMAHPRLATMLAALGDLDGARAAATRAFDLRSRLTRTERLLTEAYYHSRVSGDRNLAIDAYREVLRDNPREPIAANNLAILLNQSGSEMEEAVAMHVSASKEPDAQPGTYFNLIAGLWNLRRDDEIERVLIEAEQRFPDNQVIARVAPVIHVMNRRYGDAIAAADSLSRQYPSAAMAGLATDIRTASDSVAAG